MHVLTSTAASARLDAVAQRLLARAPASEVLIVGASRSAADDFVRDLARRAGATFGLARAGFTELAARMAATLVPEVRRAPATDAGVQAAATRAVHDALTANELAYVAPVATLPGFPRALARTLLELRLAGVDAASLSGASAGATDLARLLARVEQQFSQSAVVDRPALFELATAACASGAAVHWTGIPVVFLDVPLESRVEAAFALAVAARAREATATVPDGDVRTRTVLEQSGATVEQLPDPATAASDLYHLRRYIFTSEHPPKREPAGDVRVFSAPGEGREAVEIVRRVLDEAQHGVRLDEVAVFLRSPQQYLGLLEHACARGEVPAYFDRGTRRPDPAGRAFLALLACAGEGLSAKRFDEYLSLGQVPAVPAREDGSITPVSPVAPHDDMYPAWAGEGLRADADEEPLGGPDTPDGSPDTDDEAIVSGTLRAPWKWEELIVESSVVAGRTRLDGGARWRRRLNGLAADYRYRLEALHREEPESPLIKRLERDLRNLAHLRAFALPIIDELAAWSDRATWGEWIARFDQLATRALKHPVRVRQLLAELRPMADVPDVGLEETARVLHDRLAQLEWEPPARRYGRLFVGTPHQARGRRFRVVFMPGLAERIVPQRPREDPLLLDAARASLASGLIEQDERAGTERLLLKLAIGAATDRVYLSYPRLDGAAEGRARVPSFYALDVTRAITGLVPDYRVLASQAAEEAGASLGWPAPRDPDRAVDDLEHDLAVLRPLLDASDVATVRGRAHYLLDLNAALQRSITSRWLRDKSAWSRSDGLAGVTPTLAPCLARQRLRARPYSLSALQRFAACPYQFLLATIHRLEPWTEPEPLIRMDPLTRGSLFHAVQAEFQRLLQARQALPVTAAGVASAVALVSETLARVAAEYEERLAPAIERVWRDELDDIGRDLSIWVQRMAAEHEWIPEYFEFSFGLGDHSEGRDPRSLETPLTIDDGFVLRGSVDLIERHRTLDQLRVTDHKTGKNRATPDLIVGGGSVLQPVLYSMAVEQALAKRVVAGRLYYSTTAGGFADKSIELNDYARREALQVLTIVDRAVEQGFLVAAPAEGSCAWCDFRSVCGPHEEERAKGKASDRLADLKVLRSMR